MSIDKSFRQKVERVKIEFSNFQQVKLHNQKSKLGSSEHELKLKDRKRPHGSSKLFCFQLELCFTNIDHFNGKSSTPTYNLNSKAVS